MRVEQVNESKPSEDASKVLAAVRTAGASHSREKLGERSADRPSGSRCIGGTSSTYWLLPRNARTTDVVMCRETTSGNTMRRNTDAPVSVGATDLSVEASVMDVERSGGVIWRVPRVNPVAGRNL